jgi:hypothetical protein
MRMAFRLPAAGRAVNVGDGAVSGASSGGAKVPSVTRSRAGLWRRTSAPCRAELATLVACAHANRRSTAP